MRNIRSNTSLFWYVLLNPLTLYFLMAPRHIPSTSGLPVLPPIYFLFFFISIELLADANALALQGQLTYLT